MSKRRDGGDDEAGGLLGATAVFGPLGGAVYGVGRSLREGGRSRELGPAPIGSDPWLMTEVRSAIAKEMGACPEAIEIAVNEAVVTLRGKAAESVSARIEKAARTVSGIKRLSNEIVR